MKKNLVLFALILSFNSSFGQKIHFSDTSNVWQMMELVDYPGSWNKWVNHTTHYSGDTIVNGKKYINISPYYIREDTIAKLIYIMRGLSYHFTDTTEFVLYNYNLVAGDTIYPYFGGAPDKVWVVSVTNTLINGLSYKVWKYEYQFGTTTYNYTVIEGIGCNIGLYFPIDFPSLVDLIACFQNNGSISPLSSPVSAYRYYNSYSYFSFDNSSSCDLAVNPVAINQQNSKLYPNPISESSKIQLPYSIASGTLTITNTLGQDITQIPFRNKQELLIGHLIKSPGIYFYRVTDNSNGELFSGKFVY